MEISLQVNFKGILKKRNQQFLSVLIAQKELLANTRNVKIKEMQKESET